MARPLDVHGRLLRGHHTELVCARYRPGALMKGQGLAEEATRDDRALIADLASALGDRQVRASGLERALYGRDSSTMEAEPSVVVLPRNAEEVAAAVRITTGHGRPFVARGSGTGLAGGAVPLDGAVVIATSRMNRLLEVDVAGRLAWVEPGILNLDLSHQVAVHGLHFAPDPSSQQVCSLGGNVANNSGGPHCLAYGVTSAHVLAVEVVLPDASTVMLGGTTAEPSGYDLRGLFVGSEGTLGVATRVAVRLTPNPPVVRTLLLDFDDTDDGAATVSGIIAAGLVPAALEMMDRRAVEVVEAFAHAGYPTDAEAVLLVEVDGLEPGVRTAVATIERVAMENSVRTVRVAADEAERQALWRGRKNAFGAVARLEPDYYLHDTVVPRAALTRVLRRVYQIADHHGLKVINVFHAGDGNLHPILSYDSRIPGMTDKVHQAGREIVEASLEAGGVLSGEHGIGLEKRDYMGLMFSADDLAEQDCVRSVFDPRRLSNPDKVIPGGSRCADAGWAVAPTAGEGTWV